jgi:kynurenine formamidase
MKLKEEHIICLSHGINEDTPSYGNKERFKRKQQSSIEIGDTSNSQYWEYNNHLGTHIDFPNHFCVNGKNSSDYSAQYFWIQKVGIIELDNLIIPGQIIGVNDLYSFCTKIDNDIEVLLLKTGFEKFRNKDIYWSQNPGYHPGLFSFFKDLFPSLKFFGFDTISLTSFLNKDLGKKAHYQFLCAENPILVIEDMHLAEINKRTIPIDLVIAYNLILKADGGPVNCILKYK